MKHLAIAVLSLLAGRAYAQEASNVVWVETRFHRVHLRNGNFIDGKLLQLTDSGVLVQLDPGQMNIRRDMVDRIEFMKVRSLWEKPKLDPPLVKKADPAATPVAVAAQPVLKAIDVSPTLQKNAGMILERMKAAKMDQKPSLVEKLTELGQDGAAYLMSVIESQDADTRGRIAEAVITMKDTEALPQAAELLKSRDPALRIIACRILGSVGGIDHCSYIVPVLDDPVPAVVASALDSLRQIGGPDEIEAFAVPLRSLDRAVRVSAINGVLEMGRRHSRMVRASELLGDALFYARDAALLDHLQGIARTGRKSAWTFAEPYLRDSEPSVREAAAAVLTNLAHPESKNAVLEHLASEKDIRTRIQLASATRALKAQAAVGILVEWLREEDEAVKKTAIEILPSLTGKSFGADAEKWSEWWEQVRPR